MPLVSAGQNALLSGGLGNAVTHISLHTGDPSTTGANEVTGGSPAYARKAVTWAAAASGQRSNSGALTFDVPSTGAGFVYHFGLWDALTAGNFYGFFPIGGQTPFASWFNTSTDVFNKTAHGLTNGQQVLVYDIQAAGLVTFVEGTVYFVVSAATDNFQLSATSGGAAITTTTSFECGIHRVIPESFGLQGTLTAAVSSIVLDGRFV